MVRTTGFSSVGSSRVGSGRGVGRRSPESVAPPGSSVGSGVGRGVPELVATVSITPRLSMLAMAWSGRTVTVLMPAGVVMISSLVSELTDKG